MRVLIVTNPLPTTSEPGSLAPLARQIASLHALGVETEVLEVAGIPKLKYLGTWRALRSLLPTVDLVHAHFGYSAWLSRSQFAKPLVVSFMGSDLLGTPGVDGRLEAWSKPPIVINRWLARAVDAVIVKSAEMAEVIAPQPAQIIPNGVDFERFQPLPRQEVRRQLGWDTEKSYVLFPGNPADPRKGFRFAQAVIAHASQRLSQAVELIALCGVAPDRVPLYMNGCDAMMMTSFIEGSPNVVKEAMACNLPIVSVVVGDTRELLSKVQGYTICPRDAEVFANALVDMLTDPPEAQGRSALKRKGLDQESVAREIRRLYDRVLGQHGVTSQASTSMHGTT